MPNRLNSRSQGALALRVISLEAGVQSSVLEQDGAGRRPRGAAPPRGPRRWRLDMRLLHDKLVLPEVAA